MTRQSGSVQWIAGTAVACVLALVGAWLLLLGPMLDEAAVTREQAATVRAGNTALQASLDALRSEYAHLPEYETELAALRRQLPDDARLSDLTREISSAASGAGVTVTALDVSTAMALTGEAMTTTAPATDGSTSTGTPADGSTTDASATAVTPAPTGPVPVPPVPGMVAIPVTIKVTGSVEPVRAFLSTLQTGLQRQLLVTALDLLALEESEGDENRPASRIGDVEATIGAFAYVLQPQEAEAAGATTTDDGTLPASTGTNPFAPSVEAPTAPPVDPATSLADAVGAAIAEANAQAQAQAAANVQAQAEAAAAAAAAAAQAAMGVAAPLAPETVPGG